MPENAPKIIVRPNGPLRVEGPIALVDANGREWDLTSRDKVSLCRCGLSEEKPFCDGTHGKACWKVETYAPDSSVPADTPAS